MDARPAIDDLPGFRRRFVVTPEPGLVTSAVEDDYHCMAVRLHHDGATVTLVEPLLERAPWTTCPGAAAQLKDTFTGIALADFPARGEKNANCTHLHDLATLAANHAADDGRLTFDVLVTDAVGGVREAELRRNGAPVMHWTLDGIAITAPEELKGATLFDIKAWLAAQEPTTQEEARIFRWAILIANGRAIPLANQSDATKIPPNCFTFQPGRREVAVRVGEIKDFSAGEKAPPETPDMLFSGRG